MNGGVGFAIGLIIGAAGGGFLASKLLDQKYSQRADEEITACRNAFVNDLKKHREELAKAKDKAPEEKTEDTAKEKAEEAIEKYSNDPESKEVLNSKEHPYVISPDDYEDDANPYPAKGIKYYPEDNILVRDDKTIMTIEDMVSDIGRDALNHFGDYELSRVIIRNDKQETDYEIIMYPGHYKQGE